MVLLWISLLITSVFNAILSGNKSTSDTETSSEGETGETDEDDEDDEEEDEEMIPLVKKKKINISPMITENTIEKNFSIVSGKEENFVFGMPRHMFLFFGIAMWLEILREIVLIASPVVCVGILSYTLSETAWFLQHTGIVMLVSYMFIGWMSGKFVAKFGVQNACTSAFALVVFMITIDVVLFEFVREARDNYDFSHFALLSTLILALATIASVSNMFAICNKYFNRRHRPSKWVTQSTLRLVGEILAGLLVALIYSSGHTDEKTASHLKLIVSNVFSFLVVGQTAFTITATAFLNLY